MQDPRFSDSVFGGSFRVLGRKLRPFSYWHLFQLEAAESPFATGEGLQKTEHLATALDAAVRICRLRYPHTPKARSWPGRFLSQWRLRNLDQQGMAFARYIEFFTQRPQFWIPEGGSAPKGQMPRALAGVSALMLLGLSEAAAWNYPVGKGEWMKAAYAVHSGTDLDFCQPETKEELQRLKTLRESMKILCEALRNDGDALTPARALRAQNLITKDCFALVEEWQGKSGAERRALLKILCQELPDLTLDNNQDGGE